LKSVVTGVAFFDEISDAVVVFAVPIGIYIFFGKCMMIHV
jgi:hypothetical protein